MHHEHRGPKQAEIAAVRDRWHAINAKIDKVLTIDDTVEQSTPGRHHHFAIAAAIIGSGMLVALTRAYQPPQQNTTHDSKPVAAYDSSAHNNYSAR
jgi:hypothetical protein